MLARPVYEDHVAPTLRVGYGEDGEIFSVTVSPTTMLASVEPTVSFSPDNRDAQITFGGGESKSVQHTEDGRVKIGRGQDGKWVSIMLSLGAADGKGTPNE